MNQANYLYEVELGAPPITPDTPAYIYAVTDSETGDVIYVGSTTNPQQRFASHRTRRVTSRWANETGKKFRMFVVDITTMQYAAEAEAWYIKYFLSLGADLLNGKMPNGFRGLEHRASRQRGANQ